MDRTALASYLVVDVEDLDVLLLTARSQNGWSSKPVTDEQLRAIHEIHRWGPTSMNCQPQRVLFLRSEGAKQRLLPALAPGNTAKTLAAPVVAILAYDLRFYDLLPTVFPHNPTAKHHFEGAEKSKHAETTAFRNATLQAAYFMLAARAIGLDCGPMSGFDTARVDAEFFAYGSWRSNFLCGLGHGDPAKLYPRLPRLDFEEACRML